MKKSAKLTRAVGIGIFSAAFTALIAIVLFVVFVYKGINFDADRVLFDNSRSFNSTTFYADGSDEEGYQPVQVEIGGSLRKSFYGLDEISPYLIRGFVAVEDKSFYTHNGVDVKRTAMAALNYLIRRDKVFGASTITQQVVKNISGDNKVEVRRKLEEIVRALHIEQEYSKDDIMEVYLNVIPMSDNIYGVGAASEAYFGKPPSDLTAAEAATLIGITNAPTAYNPYDNPDNCIKKRNIVLSVMHTDGVISDSEYDQAVSEPLYVIPREERSDRFDSWFVETVIDEICVDLCDKYNTSPSASRMMLLGGGYSIYTTMNTEVQNALTEYFENTDNFPVEISQGLNYAMAVTDSHTGDLVGIVGRVGKKQGNRLLNHATVPHIPASALKPIALYAPLIDEGRINWATVFDDVPISFSQSDGGYREYPRNSPDSYDGLITVKDAVRTSKNTVAIRLCNMRGAGAVFDSLKEKFGFENLIKKEGGLTDIAVAPMALGQLCRGVSLIRLTEAYGCFPSEGVRREARSYLKVMDHKGELILENNQESERVFNESTARIMTQLLRGVTESGTARSITLKNYVETAGKTGTSSGNRDKTFVGYTPYFTAGIWCGYDSGTQSVPSLSKSHLEIWDEVMLDIHSRILGTETLEGFSTEGLLYLPYCKDSGRLYSDTCVFDPRGNRRDFGYFTENNKPVGECDRHIMCLYDSVTKAVACRSCPKENLVAVALVSVPDRSFPKEVYVSDAEYVYRDIGAYVRRPVDYSLPYFAYTLPDGEYVGISKSKKQFNSNCYLHDE